MLFNPFKEKLYLPTVAIQVTYFLHLPDLIFPQLSVPTPRLMESVPGSRRRSEYVPFRSGPYRNPTLNASSNWIPNQERRCGVIEDETAHDWTWA